MEAIGAGSQKRIGGDWGEKWRNSPELQEVKETVRQLNEEALANNHEVSTFSRPLECTLLARVARNTRRTLSRGFHASEERGFRANMS